MAIQQLSVFVENVPGSLARFASLMEKNGIDLLSVTLADTTHFGLLRVIAENNEKARQVLTEKGYVVKMTDVVAVSLPDRPGGFSHMLEVLARAGVSVEYLYSTVRSPLGNASIIVRADDCPRAEELLLKEGIKLLDETEIRMK